MAVKESPSACIAAEEADVGLIGFSVQRQFIMLAGIGCVMPV